MSLFLYPVRRNNLRLINRVLVKYIFRNIYSVINSIIAIEGAEILQNKVNILIYAQVWWSPCPSRECPEREELNLVVDKCEDYCVLNQPNDTSHKNRPSWLTKVEQSIAVGPPTLVLNNPPVSY